MPDPVTVELLSYQKPAFEFTKKHARSCLVMPTGSGKTIVALYAAFDFFLKDKENNKIIFIGPKVAENLFRNELQDDRKIFPEPIRENKDSFLQNLRTFTDPMFTQTYLLPQKGLVQNEEINQNTMLIIDEAHHLKTPTSKYFTVIARHCGLVGRLLLLTATPVTAHYEDLYTLQFLLALHTIKMDDGKYRFGLKMKDGDHANLSSLIIDFKKAPSSDTWVYDKSGDYHYLHTPFYVVDREVVYPKLRVEDQLIEKCEISEDKGGPFNRQLINRMEQFQTQTLKHGDEQSKKYKQVIKKTHELFQQNKRIFVYFPYVDKSRVTVHTICEDLRKEGVTKIFTFSGQLSESDFERKIYEINENYPNQPLVVVASDVLAESASLKCFDYVIFLGPDNVYSRVLQIIGRTIRHTSHTNCSDPQKKYENVKVLMYYSNMDTGRCGRMRRTKEIAQSSIKFMKKQKLAESPVTVFFEQIPNVQKHHLANILTIEDAKKKK